MIGRLVGVLLILTAVGGGVGMYYLQVHAFYEEAEGGTITLMAPEGPVPIAPADLAAIDAPSSPLRYRACFEHALDPADYVTAADPVPTVGPPWFECYDADATAAALASGEAVAVASDSGIYGVDRVVALWPTRGVAWHQLNPCGEAVYAGRPTPEGCPPPPEAYQD